MGRITLKTKESAGQVNYETETIYEEASDYFTDQEYKREALVNAVKSYVGNFEEPMVADVQVTKKPKETKH